MHESARLALRRLDSSVTVSVDLVRQGKADAAISAGNSGAMMAAATMRLGTLPGVQRPAIAIFTPTPHGKRVVLDAGAYVDCRPEHLADFGLMGSLYCEHALKIARPRVGVLSIGTEASKGNELSLAAAKLLADLPINFIGNVEGDQILAGEVDVTVCDGFVGNVVLKVLEGTARELMQDLRSAIEASFISKIGALLMRPALRQMKLKYDYAEYGGALLLGADGVCIVAHGRSDRRAVAKAIAVGAQSVETGVLELMRHSFEHLHGEAACAEV